MRCPRALLAAATLLVAGCGSPTTTPGDDGGSTDDLVVDVGRDQASTPVDLTGIITVPIDLTTVAVDQAVVADLSSAVDLAVAGADLTAAATDLSVAAADLSVALDFSVFADFGVLPDLATLPDFAACAPSSRRCNGNTVEVCDQLGRWISSMLCPQSCSAGMCTASTTCNPGVVRCNASNVEICNSTGTAWLYNQTCNVGCSGGVCTDPCVVNATRCNGNVPETCNGTGTGWNAGQPCTTACYLGACIATDLLIDGVTMTLDGDQAFFNSVIVRNGGQLKVGGKGYLNLRARTVSIADSGSSLVASGLGDDTRGSLTTTTCNLYSHCHNGYLCCNGAVDVNTTITLAPGGASYGVLGCTATAPSSAMCNGTDVDPALSLCPKGAPGPLYDRDDDLSISRGSKSGTSLGGGLITIYAESVTINGQIIANGTGGGSGGGVLIAADTIGGSGPIQVAGGGGSPCGGNGRVKLLRGSTYNLTGSVTGKTSLSVMPPLDIVSGSHPEQGRWYNDGLGPLFLAWSRPFPTLNNYFYLFTQNAVDVPSDQLNRGTFFMGESLVVPATQLKQGANYFHVISVNSSFLLGTVENKFNVQINTVPPAINSNSHPVQRTWYPNSAVSLGWTNPQADSNFTGYYYILDHLADTVPTTATGGFTTNKTVIFGNVLDGIWVYHLVNRDTRGATTNAAQHFVVYVGAEPLKGNLSGSVFDASNGNAPLNGVDIRINRGLFSAATNSSGTYTFGNNLYEGTWEVTASRAGYKPQVKTVTVFANQTTNTNFSLAP